MEVPRKLVTVKEAGALVLAVGAKIESGKADGPGGEETRGGAGDGDIDSGRERPARRIQSGASEAGGGGAASGSMALHTCHELDGR